MEHQQEAYETTKRLPNHLADTVQPTQEELLEFQEMISKSATKITPQQVSHPTKRRMKKKRRRMFSRATRLQSRVGRLKSRRSSVKRNTRRDKRNLYST